MKKLCSIVLVLALVLAVRATPFFIQGYQSDGTAQTNAIQVSAWPPSDSPFVTYSTNIIYGGNTLQIVPAASGYASNWVFPGVYRFFIPALSVAWIAVIPDTTNFLSVANYTTNLPNYTGLGLNSYGVVTNSLGFAPATNTTAGIEAALGYVPATNSNAGVVFALGFTPATNSYNGITNALHMAPATNNNSGIVFALGFTPATNSYGGITNSLGFGPVTNNYSGVTNALGMAPATNNTTGINFALGYTPKTNDGYTGQPVLSGAANLETNGFLVWVTYKTNNVPGTAFTNLPVGSLMTTTNGGFYSLSNLVWNAH